MKNSKILMAVFAFVIAVVFAFTTKAEAPKYTVYYKTNPDPLSSDKCISQTECTATTGNACDFTVYTTDGTAGCTGVVDRRKN